MRTLIARRWSSWVSAWGLAVVAGAAFGAAAPEAKPFAELRAEAERLIAAKSFAKAHELYVRAGEMDLSAGDKRWVAFRLADTTWRSEAATRQADTSAADQAREQLEQLVRDVKTDQDRDRVWAEVNESLGDFFWTQDRHQNWGAAWPYYEKALDWWAGTSRIEEARGRYLSLVWRASSPPWRPPHYVYGQWGNNLPVSVLENALKISVGAEAKAQAHYLLAMTLRQQGDWRQQQRAVAEFEACLQPGQRTEWRDDALYHYAEWLMQQGRRIRLPQGGWTQEPDFVKAVALFRQLTTEYKKGETRYYDQARAQIEAITRPAVHVSVPSIFLPGSEVQYFLAWRNVESVELSLRTVDLVRDLRLSEKDAHTHAWVQYLDLGKSETVKSWAFRTEDKGDHRPGQKELRWTDGKLPLGAYVLEAKAGKETARELVLVTDLAVVLKNSASQAVVYVCDVLSGKPVADAQLRLLEAEWVKDTRTWSEQRASTDANGVAVLKLTPDRHRDELFVVVNQAGRQAFTPGSAAAWARPEHCWRLYAFTDRPAYRPGDEVQWKLTARVSDGKAYSTPAEATIEFEILSPQGAKVQDGKLKLNAFGSAWASLKLTADLPLGEFRVSFWDEGRANRIGDAVLFRLEEYKLPEFKVTVQTPEVDGKKKAFRLGETVEVSIQADYYFGGPVVEADVEVRVYQNPFYHWWRPPRDFPWFYEDVDGCRPEPWRHGNGPVVKEERLRTDATGKATLAFETPAGAGQDYEYRIEARVTDSSRREITASQAVRVTRQRYYVHLDPGHYLYRPREKVAVRVKALDANEQPVQVEGVVEITRQVWVEVWLDPSGREVSGPALDKVRSTTPVFPPPPAGVGRPWRLRFEGWQHDDIAKQPVKTDANGEATVEFTPERDGHYRVAWSSQDDDGSEITADTAVWVATNATTDLGYRTGGLQLVVDQDTFRVGRTAPVMLVAPTNDRYVLFTVEAEDVLSYQVVHLTGTVKLVELPIGEEHLPNLVLSGVMLGDRQILQDEKQVVVPPVRNFLDVAVKAERDQYQPREEGRFVVTTRDMDGKPIAAEVALSVVDEAVFYIQQDYNPDPRQYFFGSKRPHLVQTQSTLNQRSYAKLVLTTGDRLIDERDLDADEEREEPRPIHGRRRADRRGAPAPGMMGGMGGGGMAMAESEAKKMLFVGAAMMDAAMPAPATAAAPDGSVRRMKAGALREMAKAESAAELQDPGSAEAGGPVVVVRTDFRATAFWQPDIVTDGNGQATVSVKYPDSVTAWKATARVATRQNAFGVAQQTTRTRMPLLVRLQAPRFFVVGDTVTVSAVVNNNTAEAQPTGVDLEAQGLTIKGVLKDGKLTGGARAGVKVPADGEARVDWVVVAEAPGQAVLKVTGRAAKFADAMEKTYEVCEHGIDKLLCKAGKVRADQVTVKLDLPQARRPGSTTLTVQVAPSLAVTMLDALPYLVDYPYGCTEQTLSRFLPAVIVAKTLRDVGLKPEAAMARRFGGIEAATADKTHPGGKRDLADLGAITKQGLERLVDFQHQDGGWGWWKDGDSDHFMTAYVLWGLMLARGAGVKVKDGTLERAVEYLDKELVEAENAFDLQAWLLHALAEWHAAEARKRPTPFQTKAFENLWTNRERLNAFARALLTLCAQRYGFTDQARTLVENLKNGVKLDRSPDVSIVLQGEQQAGPAVIPTAHWGEDGLWWRWSDGPIESTAFALRALLAVDPKHELVEPVTNWLIKNRRGAQWSNTRDTAITVLAMNDYLQASGELAGEIGYEVTVNGAKVAERELRGDELLAAPSRFGVPPERLRDNANEICIRRTRGQGPLYFSAEARFFSLEEPVTPAGHELFVRRQYYRLAERPTLLKGIATDRQLLEDGGKLVSGERVEVVVTVETKNDYEYLVFEDLKPAGLEAIEVRSGSPVYAQELKSRALAAGVDMKAPDPDSPLYLGGRDAAELTGRQRWVCQELRDRKVALFVDKLPQGYWEIRYQLRAEVPGQFHALPLLGHAMYVPEIRANGAEVRLTVEDRR